MLGKFDPHARPRLHVQDLERRYVGQPRYSAPDRQYFQKSGSRPKDKISLRVYNVPNS